MVPFGVPTLVKSTWKVVCKDHRAAVAAAVAAKAWHHRANSSFRFVVAVVVVHREKKEGPVAVVVAFHMDCQQPMVEVEANTVPREPPPPRVWQDV